MSIPAEILLVIECTRSRLTDEDTKRIRRYIEDGVRWLNLIQYAIVHAVLPTVADSLKTAAPDLLPKDVLFQFDRALARAEARNQGQWSALSKIMQRFTDEQVPLLAFKGPALTSLAYGDLRLRESADLDFWAATEQTPRAGEILRSLGYLPFIIDGGKRVVAPQNQKPRFNFMSADGTVIVDLVTPLSQVYSTPVFGELWERRCVAPGPGLGVATLSREDYLLTLAVHGEKHSWERLNWMVDFERLLTSSPDIDWDSIFDRAARWRCHRRLCSALAIRSRLYGYSTNHLYGSSTNYDDVARYLTEWSTQRICAYTLGSDATVSAKTVRTVAEGFWSHYHLMDRRSDGARYLLMDLRKRVTRLPRTLRSCIGMATRNIEVMGRQIRISYPKFTL